MLTFFKSGIIALCVALTFFSCSDHRLGGPLSPARLRLKSYTSGSATTTYTYDNQNKVATIASPDGSLGVFSYDAPDKQFVYFYEYPDPADRSKGRTTLYPVDFQPNIYTPGAYFNIGYQLFTVNPASLNIPDANRYADKRFNYSFDASKRLSGYYTSDGSDNASSRSGSGYTYTGENITGQTSAAGRTTFPSGAYQYDDKVNPFFGLMDPGVDPALRYSRNNRVRAEFTGRGYPDELRTYTYEYNAQGLPTKRTESGARTEVTTFTYEPY